MGVDTMFTWSWSSSIDGWATLNQHELGASCPGSPRPMLVEGWATVRDNDPTLKVIYHPLYDMNNYVLIWGDWLFMLYKGWYVTFKTTCVNALCLPLKQPPPGPHTRSLFCETQWPWPPLFSPSWLIQWSMGERCYITLFSPSDVTAFHRMKYEKGVLYNLVFTEWRHCVSQNWVTILLCTWR